MADETARPLRVTESLAYTPTLHKNPSAIRTTRRKKQTTYPLRDLLHKNTCLCADFA